MNIFYCNGAIPIIVAGALIKKKFAKDKNLLVIEKDYTSFFLNKSSSYGKEYYQIINILAKCSGWNKIISLKVENIFFSKDSLFWLLKIIPITHFRFIINKKKLMKRVKKLLPYFSKAKNYIVSDNSIMWKYFYNRSLNLSYIEHGAASYKYIDNSISWKHFIKSIITLFLKIDLNLRPNFTYLSDNKKSFVVNYFKKKKLKHTFYSLNLKTNIKNIFKNFLILYNKNYFDAYNELIFLKKKYKFIYIYQPTDLVNNDDYIKYLKKQFEQIIKIKKNSVFLIKPHGIDQFKNYEIFFKSIDIDAITFKIGLNKFLPTEILLFFFSKSVIFGSYSSSHLYSKWWLNKNSIFAEVKRSSVNKVLTDEYQSVYKDLHFMQKLYKQNDY